MEAKETTETITEAKVRVYDVECLYDFFCVTFVDRDSDERHHFRIWESANQVEELVEFLNSCCSGLVGFNNVNYDWPVCNYVRVAVRKLARLKGNQAARLISEFSSKILNQKHTAIREPAIPQLDLYRMHHFDNKHKAVSLKALQIAMNWPLVADMPVDHTEFSQGEEWAAKVQEYNLNDVLSTKEFLRLSAKDLTLRKKMTEVHGIDMLNHNEPKMGEDIMLRKVASAMNADFYLLRKTNTRRDFVALQDILLSIPFQTKEFQDAFSAFAAKVVDTHIEDEGEEEEKKKKEKENLYSCRLDSVRYDFGLGGMHGLLGKGSYHKDEQSIILSADVSSYYINLAIKNSFRPEHLGEAFGVTYDKMYKERKTYPKGSLEDKGLKIGLVSVTGKTMSRWSGLYDPKYFYSIVINGQLLLARLAEMCTLAGGHVIMANTDGIEVRVANSAQEKVMAACGEWARETGLLLEYKEYQALYIRDVNNYVGHQLDGKTYVKGAYEYEDLQWHKDHSMLCVPKAAVAFLTRGKPIMESLLEAPVESFFIGKRAKSGGKFEIRYVEGEDISKEQLSKTVRYLVSRKGGWLMKKEETARKASQIDAPWKVRNCMDIRGVSLESLRGEIDYRYYEQEVKRLLDPIVNVQTRLL